MVIINAILSKKSLTIMKKISLLAITMCLMGVSLSFAQSELPSQEVRAVWIATVYNLDWPTGKTLPEALKKRDLKSKLQSLKDAGINTIYFQVRTSGDAFYDSPYEPWSQYLTGEEGKTPDPYWDPLEYAVEEAHKLGMELHAWLNPYRALSTMPSDFTQKQSVESNDVDESLIPFQNKYYDANATKYKGTAERDSMHVSNQHPEWLLVLKDGNGTKKIAIFDPGLPAVRDYVSGIVADIVRRYDVDGVHFDDYFYPYPETGMKIPANSTLDDSSFALNPRGFTDKAKWRMDNIDIFIEQVNDSIKTVKPWVKFGISPFGIYRNGLPYGIRGLDAYKELYIDPLKWAENGSVDYLMPQLYWPFGGGQDFAKLANWWAKEITNRGRHLYVGTAPYRADDATRGSSNRFAANEIPRQIQHARDNEQIDGVSFFRMQNITTYRTQGFRDSLVTNYYRKPAIVPTMSWLDTTKAETPINIVLSPDGGQSNKFTLSWDRADDPLAKLKPGTPVDTLLNYAIYRVDSPTIPDVDEVVSNPENRIGLTGLTTFTDIAEPSSEGNYYYVVTAVTRNGVESDPSAALDAGVVVSTEEEAIIAEAYSLKQNYPNPFNPTTNITFNLGKEGVASLKVFDVLGREIATITNERLAQGEHSFSFNASAFSSGVYIYQLKANGVVLTKKLTLIK